MTVLSGATGKRNQRVCPGAVRYCSAEPLIASSPLGVSAMGNALGHVSLLGPTMMQRLNSEVVNPSSPSPVEANAVIAVPFGTTALNSVWKVA
ncbi:MAG: hypothetical protein M9965_16750 [Anaerolineae bacterium]|nr:hypothetical protein [Anaerolineae bacterium]